MQKSRTKINEAFLSSGEVSCWPIEASCLRSLVEKGLLPENPRVGAFGNGSLQASLVPSYWFGHLNSNVTDCIATACITNDESAHWCHLCAVSLKHFRSTYIPSFFTHPSRTVGSN
ncbi:hypothetical protein IscW_ISCW017345 [Ixodes scapularis]|uniref:Uncharacterized protein n=1 Tax=Ixodes scapularis TaxID=6945 RepID=B7P945_IXOSC|nr:hypothetical protein IscW_ISCW017345 [Ixodes scapularis]|eukprot:XP_002403586.1 hypothetical protein IscW_ISCW017345 [Ixodes scapularis]